MGSMPFPFFPLEVDKDAQLVNPAQLQAITNARGFTDLFFMSHGWNNDMNDARNLYEGFFNQVDAALGRHPELGLNPAQFAVVGVFWPSKKFADRDLIPGNAASLGDLDDAADDAISKSIAQLQGLIDDPAASDELDKAGAKTSQLGDPGAQDEFVRRLKSVLPAPSASAMLENQVEGADLFLNAGGRELFNRLNRPLLDFRPPATTDRGGATSFDPDLAKRPGAQGEAAGLGDVLGGVKGAALQILNLTTYYVMKERAATVGHGAVNQALKQIQQAAPNLRIHLAGHSFGSRVVTSAAQGPQPVKISSMALLQAAFSHYGFSDKYDDLHPERAGFFRSVINDKRVRGPVIISHTRQDLAVGIAYAIASRIAGQIAADLGDANDPYGGLGRNGAQKTPGVTNTDLLTEGTGAYNFQPGSLYNLKADAIITSHGDISRPEVAFALVSSVSRATKP